MGLVEKIYRITRDFPKEEQFGVISQIRRAAMSVPLNIAEGKGRFHTKSFILFLYQARGSLFEVITLIKLSEKLEYMNNADSEEAQKLCGEIAGGLNALVASLK